MSPPHGAETGALCSGVLAARTVCCARNTRAYNDHEDGRSSKSPAALEGPRSKPFLDQGTGLMITRSSPAMNTACPSALVVMTGEFTGWGNGVPAPICWKPRVPSNVSRSNVYSVRLEPYAYARVPSGVITAATRVSPD